MGNPSGLVNFYANGSWIGWSNLTAGTATFNASLAFPGIYSITAQYAGDSNNLASNSPGVSEAITGSTVFGERSNGHSLSLRQRDGDAPIVLLGCVGFAPRLLCIRILN